MILSAAFAMVALGLGAPPNDEALQAALLRAKEFEAQFDNVKIEEVGGDNISQATPDWPYTEYRATHIVIGNNARRDLGYVSKKTDEVFEMRRELRNGERYAQWNYSVQDPDGTAAVEASSNDNSHFSIRMYTPFTSIIGVGRFPVKQLEGSENLRLAVERRPGATMYADCEWKDGDIRILDVWPEYLDENSGTVKIGTHYIYEYPEEAPRERFQIAGRIRMVHSSMKVDTFFTVKNIEFKPSVPNDFFEFKFTDKTWVTDRVLGVTYQKYREIAPVSTP